MAFEGLSDKLSAVFKKLRNKGKLTESDVKAAMREVRLALLEADVNYKVAKDFVAKVSERAVGAEVLESLTPAQHVIKIVNEELTALMGESNARINFSSKIPTVIMMVGLQGSGKTTHSGKLALHFKKQGKRPLLVACDVYRPAAIDQLKVVGSQIDVPVFEMGQIDPVEIAKKAISHAKDYGNDIVILDTAGRLHIDTELMDELRRSLESMDRAYHQKSTTSSTHYGACSSDSSLVCCAQRYTLHLNNCVTILFVCGIFIMTMELVNDEDENEHTIRTTRRLP